MHTDTTTAGQPGAPSCSKGQQVKSSRSRGDIVSPLHPGLAHVTVRKTARGRHLGVDQFDVPLMAYEDGYRYGLRVAADALTWAASAPHSPNPAVVLGGMVRAAVVIESAEPRYGKRPSRRPAASGFLRVMEEAMRAAAVFSWHQFVDDKLEDFDQGLAAYREPKAKDTPAVIARAEVSHG